MKLNYFGTTLSSAGHYLFELNREQFDRSRYDMHSLPFNPEGLPHGSRRNNDWEYYSFAGFSIIAICGSCKDKRPGSKTIFFIEGEVTKGWMILFILENKLAKQMLDEMKFQFIDKV